MWEVSTPCVYARWFLAHLGQHNSRLYLANGLAMLGTFFVARNLLGLREYLIMFCGISDARHNSNTAHLALAAFDWVGSSQPGVRSPHSLSRALASNCTKACFSSSPACHQRLTGRRHAQ